METKTKIARMNDLFRNTLLGGKVMLTGGITELTHYEREKIITAVRTFTKFDEGDDPYGEHDFGAVEVGGNKVFWKIDYYDKALEYGSENPADPAVTTRVLTIMKAEEY